MERNDLGISRRLAASTEHTSDALHLKKALDFIKHMTDTLHRRSSARDGSSISHYSDMKRNDRRRSSDMDSLQRNLDTISLATDLGEYASGQREPFAKRALRASQYHRVYREI